jgi:molybdopterin converting factor small subunit
MIILYFAHTRRITGVPQEVITVSGPISIQELWDLLINRHPTLAPFRLSSRFARHNDFLLADARIEPNDEIALIPPVSGG